MRVDCISAMIYVGLGGGVVSGTYVVCMFRSCVHVILDISL